MIPLYTEMANLLGENDARQIIQRLGGNRFYVPFPKNLTRNHKLSQKLGFHRAKRFCKAFAGDILDIPKAPGIRASQLVAVLDRAGYDSAEIAWLAGMDRKHICQILAMPQRKFSSDFSPKI